jgi:hypothetical protein
MRDHLTNIFPKSFIEGEYKKHRESILYDREKCMLPSTQAELEIDMEKKKVNDAIKEYNKQKYEFYTKIWDTKFTIKEGNSPYERRYIRRTLTDEEKKKIEHCESEIKKIDALMVPLRIEKNRLQWAHLGGEKQEERRQFVKNCPGDGCNGFLSTQWKCGLCGIKVCNKCHEVKQNGNNENVDADTECTQHTCDENAVKAVEAINKETKPCPSCGTRIFKLEGCSQMFCTNCFVAFDWRSLRICTGVIHNPHFYEYQRKMNGGVAPRVPGDVPCCEQIPHIFRCLHIWNDKGNLLDKELSQKLTDMHRMLVHIQNYEITRVPNNFTVNDNKDVRKKFLLNEINEERFKWFLQKREKKRYKGRELRQLYEMIVACGADFIRRSIDVPEYKIDYNGKIENIIKEFETLSQYFNDNSKKISNAYGGVVPRINYKEQSEKGGSWCVLLMTEL